jgi:hypothetical protein
MDGCSRPNFKVLSRHSPGLIEEWKVIDTQKIILTPLRIRAKKKTFLVALYSGVRSIFVWLLLSFP